MPNEKVVSLTFDSSLSNLCEANSSFDTGVLRICYTGNNRNGSAISKADIERNLHTIYNCPVVCHYDRETDTLGGHDMEVVADDGGLRLVNMTQPVGVIPESANTWFAEYEEEDGTVHEYLYADVLLWKRQEAYRKIKNDGVTAHSMEVTVKNGETVDGVYHIHDFEFTAFALIGVEPCFEGSALEMFSANEFKAQYAQMMRELKDEYSTVNSANADGNKEKLAKGGEEVLEQEMELVEEIVQEPAAEVFEMSDAAEEHAEEMAEPGQNEQFSAEEAGADYEEDTFALNSNIVEELRKAVRSVTYKDRWGDECCKYWFVDCDIDASMVYCEECDDWKLYGFSYSMNGDSVVIDFESKKRMKWIIADFNEGDQDSPVDAMFTELDQKIADNAEWESKYQSASDTMASMQGELNELREYKMNAETKAAEAARNSLFAMFEDLEGNEAFEELKKNCEQYDIESLEEKCYALRGRNGTSAKFSVQESAPKIKVEKTVETADEPYGGLFIKYRVQK